MIRLRCLLFVSCVAVIPPGAIAHDARPISLEVTRTGDQFRYVTRLKVPDTLRRPPVLLMPESCEPLKEATRVRMPGAITVRQPFECDQSIRGNSIALEFPGSNPSLSTVVRVVLAGGLVYSTILPPSKTRWQVPEQEEALMVAGQYTWLGVEHIWLGIDHLLFVLCLLFVAARVPEKRWRRMLITITGFTVAHSLTLILSILELVSLPTAAVEAVIALSIVFLALEILRDDPGSWTYRYPVSVAASFGLLHGFGFAAVLRDIGLPQTELPVALLFFNVGVEAGQILFVLMVLACARLFGGLVTGREVYARALAGYFVGAVSTWWLIDRTFSFWI